MPAPHASSRWIRRLGITLVALLCADLSVWAFYSARVRGLREAGPEERFDAAVVFFGGRSAAGGLDYETSARVMRAARLYADGRAVRVIAVGGARPDWPRTGSAIMSDSLVRLGVAPAAVSRDSNSYDSRSNWREAVRIARAAGARRVALVSSRTHLYRLEGIARDSELTVALVPSDDPSASLPHAWMTAHREIAALVASALLPARWYDALIRRGRGWTS